MSLRELKEPLIDERQSVSPASSPRESSNSIRYDDAVVVPSNSSLLSQAVRQAHSRTPNDAINASGLELHKVMISVHYWAQYNKGQHLMHSLEVYQNQKVIDVIEIAVKYFSEVLMQEQTQMDSQIGNYLLRFANKQGLPKSDMPYLDAGQSVMETCYFRFALCHRMVDEKAKVKLRAISNLEDVSKFETLPQSMFEAEKKETKKRNFLCCCFSSD